MKVIHRLGFANKCHLFGIGGRVPKLLLNDIGDAKFWNELAGIYVESPDMVKSFENKEIVNAKYVPNCKSLPQYTNVSFCSTGRLKLFYIGKICYEKGIDDLISAVNELNDEGYNCSIDLYGPIDEKFCAKEFINGNVKFYGEIDLISNVSNYQKLLKYDCFVFPTKWVGEGFAGSLIDAMALGKPIIASDINYNSYIVKNGEFGLIFHAGDITDLKEKIKIIYCNKELLNQYGEKALLESKKYEVNNVLDRLFM